MDFSFKNTNELKQGCVLLSDPFEDDLHFRRAVVIVCNHDDTGSFGFVLNNYIDLAPGDLNEQFSIIKGRVSIGGPVEKSSLFFMHTLGEFIKGSVKIKDNLFYGGDFEELCAYLIENPIEAHRVRLFVGYSGWDANQLEEELYENAWIVVEEYGMDEIMNTESDGLWKKLMTAQGLKFKLLSDFPLNPKDN